MGRMRPVKMPILRPVSCRCQWHSKAAISITTCTSHLPKSVQEHTHRRQTRNFHDYFVTLLPSSSQHPDSRPGPGTGSAHKLPRNDSVPHSTDGTGASPASFRAGHGRDMTTFRIPLKKAKHHFGASNSRGTRPYNEDTYQAGTIVIPSFAKKGPMSLTGRRPSLTPSQKQDEGVDVEGAESEAGDPQVFYFGVFDGHGGDTCSIWLRDNLHEYLENAVKEFRVPSALRAQTKASKEEDEPPSSSNDLSKKLMEDWRDTVGGYFRRFKPEHFSEAVGGKGKRMLPYGVRYQDRLEPLTSLSDPVTNAPLTSEPTIESALTYAFLKGDLDFTVEQARVANEEEEQDDELEDQSFGRHSHHSHSRFLGGSTCSIALISTPTPTPFWNPQTPLSIITAHIGDTRILLCSVASGGAIPITQDHHPSTPVEAERLRKYSAMVTTDSFGEERISGLANTRAFGDARSKRIGVSAEPELKLMHISASSQYSFLVLVSDGVTASLSDQEIVDTIKEARTPDQGARDVVSLATDLASSEKGNADNATALVVRLGGWERRAENGGGGMHTKEQREWRKTAANDPRRGRT